VTRIAWGTFGERYYETGVDRGVLYIPAQAGVAWNGLASVSESPSGGDAKPYYIDGFKYMNVASAEEFEATISAYSSPSQFGPCDGTKSVHTGLFVTQQPRIPFGFSYRTMVGNDATADRGYKIHLVYNALAAPAQRPYRSLSSSGDPTILSWSITSKPPTITGYKPTAHLIIDSRTTLPDVLTEVEDLLYGTSEDDATLPTPDELIAIFA
jgi:hypothetical protein